ncbi:GDSL-type esterase/lipase family protein [Sphingomonas nostoxanthinifaciens]|uniref:GDSL-type esterase/lipase family protein n=1 Tax=Sphingomonas nostoxanthinifaciens TaxID=2872652 RepID=UPI001CC1C747|nr:GDSL-type esterase/lipase family protein [Sphingomonas nostoxanthinifaciens]UAK23684.1 putative Ig domain-containing protein [Sphingomonas nostoxanthinifaciens]
MPMFPDIFGDIRRRFRGGGSAVDAVRAATFSKVLALTALEQATSRQDAAALALVPGAATGAATLTNLYTQQSNPGVFEAFGGAPLVTSDPRLWVIVQMDDAPNTGGGMNAFMPGGKYYWQFSTEWRTRVVNTRYIEIATKDTPAAGLRLWVNGQLAIAGKQPFGNAAGAGDLSYTKFDLGAVGNYDIVLECNGAIRFYGIGVDAGGSCVKQTRASTGTILCLGDSYTSGASYNAVRGQDLMRTLGRYLGFHNVVTAGLSGSSMVTTTGTAQWSLTASAGSIYTNFITPIIKPAIDPDVIVISLGYNDNGSVSPTVAALYALWQQVRADFPRSLIVCMGMWGGVIQARTTLQNREEQIRAQFNTWADPFSIFVRLQFATGGAAQSAVQFGQGYTGTPSYDGINDLILNGDRNHLNDGYANQDGQWYMATKIRDAILTELNAMGATYNPAASKAAYWPLSLKLAGGQSATATVGSPFLCSLMSTGGGFAGSLPGAPTALPAKVHSIVAGGTIPPGLTLNATQAMLTGTPTTAGTYNFTVHCVDSISGGTVDLPCTITVS